MQFVQPGFNYGQPFVFNTPPPFNGLPEIIGEGNVTSFISPDGSVQFLFLPTGPIWKPYPWNPNSHTNTNPNSFQTHPIGAWIIRSIYNPFQQPALNPSCNVPILDPKPVPFTDILFPTPPSNNFHLKFHNDCCTSTSDIHYFFPRLRNSNWLILPQRSASVQVDTPVNNSQVICDRACKHAHREVKKPEHVTCMCHEISTSASSMSIVTSNEKLHKKRKAEKKKCKRKKSSKREKKVKNRKSQTDMSCDCKEEQSDKCVMTYADKACNAQEQGRPTQTNCCTGIPLRKISSTFLNKQSRQPPNKVLVIKTSESSSGPCASCYNTTSDSE